MDSCRALARSLAVAAPLLVALQNPPPPVPPPTPPPGQSFGPGHDFELTLERALSIALQSNLGLQVESLQTDIARYNARGSWGEFDWIFNARAGISEGEFEAEDPVTGGSGFVVETDSDNFGFDFTKPTTTGGTFRALFDSVNTDTNSGSSLSDSATSDVVALTYRQPLWRGAWREYATSFQREAELEARRQGAQERETTERLLLEVANAYWDLVSAKEQLDVAESGLGLAREQVDQNQRRLDAGVGTEVEVLQAETEVATREEQRLLAEVRTRQTADVLMRQLFPGTDAAVWETTLVPRTPLPDVVTTAGLPAWTDAFAVAVAERSELVQQRFVIEAADVRHSRARSEKHPGLDLDLSAVSRGFDASAGDAFDKAAGYEFPTYGAALVFNVPLGNKTARYAEKAAWAQLRQARLQYNELESTIVGEVRESVRQVGYQAEAVRAAMKSRELAERQLSAEQARYQEGLSTTFQVLQFQQDYVAAMSREKLTRVNYAKASIALLFSQGILSPTLVK
jgi:outer membrane protein TolC